MLCSIMFFGITGCEKQTGEKHDTKQNIEETNDAYTEEDVENTDDTYTEKENSKIHLDNVVYDRNKVNVYLFYLDTCIYCHQELDYFENIQTEYEEYFTLHAIEISSESNHKIMEIFASKMGDDDNGGVPYTIIGRKTITGFGEETEAEIINAIMSEHKDSYDVNFE